MSAPATELLQCYNKGCGQKYDPTKNTSTSCTYHPGEPFFHDAYKGWSCCNKKCTDFTEFLNFKGCTSACHSNVKPVEPEKPKVDKSKAAEVITYTAPRINTNSDTERPSEAQPLARLAVTISPSLKQALQTQQKDTVAQTECSGDDVKIGTSCKNNGCRKVYEGEDSIAEMCSYHPGTPIFHEGLKYWTCCMRKTTDFDVFLEQVGCNTGDHVWMKKDTKKVVNCRYDWHQTGTHVYVSFYAKNSDPALSSIEANPVKLRVRIAFGESVFEMQLILRGVIDVEQSSVNMAASKVEIKLKKAGGGSWDKLSLPDVDNTIQSLAEVDLTDVTAVVNTDNIDLSNIDNLNEDDIDSDSL